MLARLLGRIFAAGCFTLAGLILMLWVRSFWKIDMCAVGGLVAFSSEQRLIVGRQTLESAPAFYTSRPAKKDWTDMVIWALFIGDAGTENDYSWHHFQLSWRPESSDVSYWFAAVPTWSLAIPFALLPPLSVLIRAIPSSKTSQKQWAKRLWLLLYLPPLIMLFVAWQRPDPLGFASTALTFRDRLMVGTMLWFGVILGAYAWRVLRCWPRAAVRGKRGFELVSDSAMPINAV
jgi:hypothetical protein